MANIITGIRIVISVILLFCPALSPVFLVFYIAAGITDMTDGAVARKTNTVSKFGSRLDTAADIVFAAVCMIKLLPAIHVPIWLGVWIAVIAVIKAWNIAVGYIRQKELISVHSALNKVTGGLLFIFPLTLSFTNLICSAVIVCIVATIAAIHEGYLINRKVMN